jgi:hypothetical protein
MHRVNGVLVSVSVARWGHGRTAPPRTAICSVGGLAVAAMPLRMRRRPRAGARDQASLSTDSVQRPPGMSRGEWHTLLRMRRKAWRTPGLGTPQRPGSAPPARARSQYGLAYRRADITRPFSRRILRPAFRHVPYRGGIARPRCPATRSGSCGAVGHHLAEQMNPGITLAKMTRDHLIRGRRRSP